MKKIIIGVVTGFILATLLAIPVVIAEMTEKEKFGRIQGQTQGELLVYEFLNKYVEADKYPEEYVDVYVIKDVAIYVVEKNGEKTIQTKSPNTVFTPSPPRGSTE